MGQPPLPPWQSQDLWQCLFLETLPLLGIIHIYRPDKQPLKSSIYEKYVSKFLTHFTQNTAEKNLSKLSPRWSCWQLHTKALPKKTCQTKIILLAPVVHICLSREASGLLLFSIQSKLLLTFNRLLNILSSPTQCSSCNFLPLGTPSLILQGQHKSGSNVQKRVHTVSWWLPYFVWYRGVSAPSFMRLTWALLKFDWSSFEG